MSVLVLLFIFLPIFYILHFYWKVSKYPKGPTPIPFFGNIFQFPKVDVHQYIDDLSKIYGPCFTIWSPLPIVVLADYDHIKDAFVTQGDTFTYRSHRPPETLIQPHENTGILISDGDTWRAHRRTSLKILRDFGLGKNLMEEQVVRSIHEMLEQLESVENDSSTDLHWPIQLCVGNVINETLFGYHFSYKDSERFKKFVGIIDYQLKAMQGGLPLMINGWPWLKHVPYIGEIGYHRLKRNIDSYHKFIESEVNSQIENYNADNEPENYVHAYLQEMRATGNPELNKTNLCASVLDFWLAGMETTSTSLRWHIAYMLKFPEIQDKVRQEIHSVVGTSRLPSMTDKPNMPYTQAVIHEVQRHSNMIPFLGSHRCIEDTKIQGKPIPAGTTVFAQIWSVLRNDKAFDGPLDFNPNRFLLEDQKSTNKAVLEKSIAFSIGKRSCVGEGLARMELFLIFSALIQKYEFVPTGPIDLTPAGGAVLSAKPYSCKLVKQF